MEDTMAAFNKHKIIMTDFSIMVGKLENKEQIDGNSSNAIGNA
jgi:hypothetical protein